MKSRIIILRAMRHKKKKQRGLEIISPNKELSQGHINKALHNLQVMSDLQNLKHTDWVVVVAYYAMYHGATALLAHIGLESKEHATTVAILEYFFSKEIDKTLLLKFHALKQKKDSIEQLYLEDKFLNYLWQAKVLRENAQYGTNTLVPTSEESLPHARDFVSAVRLLLNKLDEEYVSLIRAQMNELQEKLNKK